ncbi:MAG TPA: hypothetical protein VGR73_05200 [Bryobacteraceae bacterium]|nr:hypothetical protein [Bryobacteraceae bacterium]
MKRMADAKNVLVFSAHAADFVWRAGGAIGKRRGTQAVRNHGPKEIKYAEAFQRVYPQVTNELS